MKNNITKPIVAGLIAAAVMTLISFMAPLMGLPKMNAAEMLSMIMGVPLIVGWGMHFMIGTVFAFGYALIFSKVLHRISNEIFKGVVYGVIVFVFAQIAMAMMGLILPMPPVSGNMVLMMVGGVIGHIAYGISLGLALKENVSIQL